MVKHTLSDDFELKGLWWLPETPDTRVPGIVTFDSEGINLELFGFFQKPTSSYRDPIWDPTIILGRAEGSLVTLYHALTTESPPPRPAPEAQGIRPQLHRSTFNVAHMFIGAHFESEAEIQFTSLEANFTHLEEWMGREHIPFESDETDAEYTATYSYPEAIDTRVSAKESVVSIGSSFSSTGPRFKTLKLKHNALLSIYPDEQKSLEWYQSSLRDCQNLLTLLVGRPVHPQWIKAYVEGEYRTDSLLGSIDLFSYQHSRPLRRTPPPPWNWRWDKVLVPLPSVEPNLEQLFNAWFDNAELLRPVYTLFFGTLYNSEMYAESEFLGLAQALEVFHRRTSSDDDDKYFPKEEFEAYRQAMLTALPENARSRLRDRLTFLNEYSLKDRLDDLFRRVSNDISVLVTEEPDDFIRTVRDTRNHLTHYPATPKRRVLKEDEYFGANKKLRLWLMILLLLELGLNDELVNEAAGKYREQYFPKEDLR